MLRVRDIGNLGFADFGVVASGEVKKLIDLVRADVAKNATVFFGLPEPVRACCAAAIVSGLLHDLMRRDVDGLDDATDGAGLNEIGGFDGGGNFEHLAVKDAVDAFGLGDGLADFSELGKRGHAGLVAEEVFAALHHLNAESSALVGNCGAEHELDRGVVENFFFGCGHFCVRIALVECGDFVRLSTVGRDEYATTTLDCADHAVNVIVAHAADGEADGIFRFGGGIGAGLRNFMHDGAIAEWLTQCRQASDDACRADALQKQSTIHFDPFYGAGGVRSRFGLQFYPEEKPW